MKKNISMPKSMREKITKRKDAMPKKHEPEKKREVNKDSPYFQKFQSKRERGMTKEFKNPYKNIPHTCTS
jgi:hypothetical protein